MVNEKNNKIAKAGVGYIVGNYLLKGITFLSAPIFTRLLTVEEYGLFGTYISYEAMIYILVGVALHSSINSAAVKYKEKIREYISSIVLLTLVSMLLWIINGNILYPLYGGKIGFSQIVINVLLLHATASSLQQIYSVKISLNYEYKSYLKISWFNALFNMALSVLLILTIFDKDRVVGRIIGTAIPLVIIGVFVIVSCFKEAKPTINKEYWKYACSYSLPIVPHGLSQIVLNSFDRIMIKNMTGAAEAGVYSFAYNVNSIVLVAKNSLENVWKPWFYEKMSQKRYEEIKRGATNYAVGVGLFTILIIFACPELIKILGAEQYWGSLKCVIPVVVGGFFSFLYSIPSIVEYFYEKTNYIAIGTVAAAAINIGLNFVFIPSFGYIAAAYTTLITYFLYFIFHFILAWKIHGNNIFSIRSLVSISCAVLMAGVTVIIVENNWIVRWGAIVMVSVITGKWSNDNFDILNKIKKKLVK